MRKTAVVIPLYKSVLNEMEKISIHQLLKVLYRYPKFFILPRGLNIKSIERDNTCLFLEFDKHYFLSTKSYSQLLVSIEFYRQFKEYEYILIYQTDAFVFHDNLDYFCQLGYDYIGAPWWFWSKMYRCSKNLVGNGGLSLRHIQHTLDVLENHEKFIRESFLPKLDSVGEDVLFSYFGAHEKYKYSVAPTKIAKQFSLECDYQKSYSKLSEELPFGCHHWWNGDFDIWRPYVMAEGYAVESCYPYAKMHSSRNERIFNIIQYLMGRIIRYGESDCIERLVKLCIPKNKMVIVWGAGKIGSYFINLLKKANGYSFYVFDKKSQNVLEDGIWILYPDDEMLKQGDCYVIISTEKFHDEIVRHLTKIGMNKKDYLSYIEFGIMLIKQYYGNA